MTLEGQREKLKEKLAGDREKFLQTLADIIRCGMFGDGLEEQYILDGVEYKGLNNMTDEELISEAEMCGMETGE